MKELPFKFTIFLGIYRLINNRIVYFPYCKEFGSFCILEGLGKGKGGKLFANIFGGGGGGRRGWSTSLFLVKVSIYFPVRSKVLTTIKFPSRESFRSEVLVKAFL